MWVCSAIKCQIIYRAYIVTYPVRPYLQWFVGGLMSYLSYLRMVVSNTECAVFMFFLSSCLPYFAFDDY